MTGVPVGPPSSSGPRLHGAATIAAAALGFGVVAKISRWPLLSSELWDLVLFGSFITAVTTAVLRRQTHRRLHIAIGVLAGFGAYTLASVLVFADQEIPYLLWSERLSRALVIGATAYLLSTDRRQIRALTIGAIAGGFVVAGGGLFGVLGLDAVDPENGRLVGPLGDPNYYAQYQAVGVALATRVALAPGVGLGIRVVSILATAAGMSAIVISESRGGLVAVILTTLLLYSQVPRRHRAKVLLVAVLAMGYVIGTGVGQRLARAPASVVDALEEENAADDGAVSGRVSENLAALRMFQDHPLFGVGWANYPRRYLDYSVDLSIDDRAQERHAHNYHLETLAETGLVGALLWGAIVLISLRGMARVRRSTPAMSWDHITSDAWRLALWSWLYSSVFLHDTHPDLQWLIIGIAVGVPEMLTSASPPNAADVSPAPERDVAAPRSLSST